MLEIDALPAFNDNYIWLLRNPAGKECAVVDPGDAAPVRAWLAAHPDWRLTDILITHHHFDHVGGAAELQQATAARVHGPATEKIPVCDHALNDGDKIRVLGHDFSILHVPGHTLGHIAYYHDAATPLLFCGDTLFAAGCGRLFEGTAEQMHDSLSRLAALPDATLVYCAHEYTLSNLRFAQAVEPHNAAIAARIAEVERWRSSGRISLPSSLQLERATNPFLRCEETSVKQILSTEKNLHTEDPKAAFAALRAWKDHF